MAETPSKLIACIKCSTNYPSIEFSSQNNPVCKKCRRIPVLKCVYCRSDFKQESKLSSSSIPVCPKCEKNVKLYGKPKNCIYCRINAAFIGSKCQRCTHLERKYGLPIICEQCKQKCAFNRKDEKEIDWKPLCWLCTLSYKRALAKTKQRMEQKTNPRSTSRNGEHSDLAETPEKSAHHKKHKDGKNSDIFASGKIKAGDYHDEQSELLESLKEKTIFLEKQVVMKDAKLLEKDKEITRLQAEHFTKEQEMKNANNSRKHAYDKEVENLHATVKSLQREVARLKKMKTTNNSVNATNSPLNNHI